MIVSQLKGLKRVSVVAAVFALSSSIALAGTIKITSPQASATVKGQVSISASASESAPFHLELWDNGQKLGNFFSSAFTTGASLPVGNHVVTVVVVSPMGKILNQSSVAYKVAAIGPPPPSTGAVTITNPAVASTSISAVRITAAATVNVPVSLVILDNGVQLGKVPAASVDGIYVLPTGSHVLSVQAVDGTGSIVNSSTVNYTVAESCVNSRTQQCDLDQLPVDDTQNDCHPKLEAMWVANPCGSSIQGVNPTNPSSTHIESIVEGGALFNQGNLTLNGHSVHFVETQGTTHPSNVLFRGQSPTQTPKGQIDSHWVMDEYVYLPNLAAHQAFEMDAQYTGGGIWSKFYTECAFNHNKGTGFWGLYDKTSGGWIFLNGIEQGGQIPPIVPCNKSQFAQPWPGSANPSFTGWHHIAWAFLRNPDGTVTYQSITFDGVTTPVNFTPITREGGNVNDSGYFGALIQLDGIRNTDGTHDVVDAYVSELSFTHTP